MRFFQSEWILNIPRDQYIDAIRVVCRPGSEMLTLPECSMVFPHLEDLGWIDPAWPRWGIGTLDGRLLAMTPAPGNARAPEGMDWRRLRNLLPFLQPGETEALCRASMLASWNDHHRYCGRCGTPTELDPGEAARVCPACGHRAYPRISPAMIVRITDGRRILLAHNKRFPSGVYSCVAGYTDPGETLERTILREIKEEVGLEAEAPRYVTSQAWPFPHSLMLGFETTARGEPIPDGVEILDAQWFDAHRLPPIPRPGTIARYLIDLWLEGLG